MHAEVRIDDTVLMLADPVPPGWQAVSSHVHIYVRDVDESDRKALDAGAISVQEPVKKQDKDKRGGVKDPGGLVDRHEGRVARAWHEADDQATLEFHVQSLNQRCPGWAGWASRLA